VFDHPPKLRRFTGGLQPPPENPAPATVDRRRPAGAAIAFPHCGTRL